MTLTKKRRPGRPTTIGASEAFHIRMRPKDIALMKFLGGPGGMSEAIRTALDLYAEQAIAILEEQDRAEALPQ